jgi:hypothetical protein
MHVPVDAGKRKKPSEPRHGTRLQQKQLNKGGTSRSSSHSRHSNLGMITIVDNFSFVSFTDSEVISIVTLNIFFDLSICKTILNFIICLV